MKKIYIKDLETEKRNYLIKLNSKLIKKLQEDLYEVQMDQQSDDFNYMLDEEAQKEEASRLLGVDL